MVIPYHPVGMYIARMLEAKKHENGGTKSISIVQWRSRVSSRLREKIILRSPERSKKSATNARSSSSLGAFVSDPCLAPPRDGRTITRLFGDAARRALRARVRHDFPSRKPSEMVHIQPDREPRLLASPLSLLVLLLRSVVSPFHRDPRPVAPLSYRGTLINLSCTCVRA